MNSKQVKEFCQLDEASEEIMKQAVQSFQLSARSYFRILKLARTIADLSEHENIISPHILEALSYRKKELS